MSWATNWPKNGQPAASLPSEPSSSSSVRQSHNPPARPSANRKASSAEKDGSSGNIRAYRDGASGASTGRRARAGARQCVGRKRGRLDQVKARASSSPMRSHAHSCVSGNTASTEWPRAVWVRSARRRRRNARMFRPRSAAGRRGSVSGPSYRARQRQSPRSRPRRRRCRPPHRGENQGLAPEPAPARPKYDARDASRGRAIAACTLEQSWLLQFRQVSQKRVPDHIVRWYRARQPGAVVAAPPSPELRSPLLRTIDQIRRSIVTSQRNGLAGGFRGSLGSKQNKVLAPTELRGDVFQDAFDHVGVVVHAERVRYG